jgi:hypothetical protein
MPHSPRRRTRRRRNSLVALVTLVILALVAWHYLEEFFAPNIIARVLFCETANCSQQERKLVAGVMQNRIGNPAFGHSATLKAVVEQPGAFSCVGDRDNTNWQKTRHPERMTAAEKAIWQACISCVSTTIPSALGPSGRPLIYYHDKSIGKPASWDNTQWRAVREISTEHFVFYSIIPVKPPDR